MLVGVYVIVVGVAELLGSAYGGSCGSGGADYQSYCFLVSMLSFLVWLSCRGGAMKVIVGLVEPAISLYACWCLCDRSSWCG